MKKQFIQKVLSSGKEGDNEVHLQSLDPGGMGSTACGDCDVMGAIYTETNMPLTCKTCIDIYEYLKNGIRVN